MHTMTLFLGACPVLATDLLVMLISSVLALVGAIGAELGDSEGKGNWAKIKTIGLIAFLGSFAVLVILGLIWFINN